VGVAGRVGERERAAADELGVGGRHLVQCQGVVEGRDGDVAAIEDLGPGLVRVNGRPVVEASETGLPGGGGADGAWAETGALYRLA